MRLLRPASGSPRTRDDGAIALADVLRARSRQLVILRIDGSSYWSGPHGSPPVFIYYNGRNHYTAPDPRANQEG